MRSPRKNLGILGALHALFFIGTAFFIFFVKEKGDYLLAAGFLIAGVWSLVVWRASARSVFRTMAGSVMAALTYWLFAFYYGRYLGFINGISITVSLMALLGIVEWLKERR